MVEKADILKKVYEDLLNSLQINGDLKNNSVIISLMRMRSNRRLQILEECSINLGTFPTRIKDELLRENLMRPTDKLDEYAMTAKGIWNIEKVKISPEDLIEYIGKAYFGNYEDIEKSLKEKEKVVLFAMMAIRAFSNESCINLKKDSKMLEKLKELLDDSYEKLKSLNLISGNESKDIYGGSNTESKISYLFRHLNDLPKKTKHLFVFAGGSAYFLNLSNNNKIDKEKTAYILKQIWGEKKLNKGQIQEVYDFLCKTASSKSIFIFNEGERTFSNPSYDNPIKESLYDSL